MKPLKGSHDVVIAVVSDFDELVGHAKGFGLLLDDFEAVENVGFHVNVRDKASYLMTLLDYLVKCRTAVFPTAPMNNHFHTNSTPILDPLDDG